MNLHTNHQQGACGLHSRNQGLCQKVGVATGGVPGQGRGVGGAQVGGQGS